MASGTYKRIYAAVRRVPRGSVATYGQIARVSGASGPRQVGYALHATPADVKIPWHRVINSKGEISLPKGSESREIQQTLLEAEGIVFRSGRVALAKFQWKAGRKLSKNVL